MNPQILPPATNTKKHSVRLAVVVLIATGIITMIIWWRDYRAQQLYLETRIVNDSPSTIDQKTKAEFQKLISERTTQTQLTPEQQKQKAEFQKLTSTKSTSTSIDDKQRQEYLQLINRK